MAEQSGSMQFSGEVNQARSPSTRSPSTASASASIQGMPLAQAWTEPARNMLSQFTGAFGQMPVRMLEQEASMMQNSFGSPRSWLPNVFNAWEEPLVMMRKVSEEMDQYLGKMMQVPLGKIVQTYANGSSSARNWTPTVEIAQLGDQMVICADLPGLTKEDVQLKVHEDKITIEGERREENISQDVDGYHRTERSYGRFYRSIPLPEGVDGSSAEAKMRDGVLEITVPLPKEHQRGVRLEIREAEEGELREQKEAPRTRVVIEQTRRETEESGKSAHQASQEPRRDQQPPRQAGNAARTEAKA